MKIYSSMTQVLKYSLHCQTVKSLVVDSIIFRGHDYLHLKSSFSISEKMNILMSKLLFSSPGRWGCVLLLWFVKLVVQNKACTVTYTESGTPMLNWDSRYHSLSFLNWNGWNLVSRDIFSRCLDTCKISALYLLYFKSYESFCGVFSDFH